MEEAVRTDLIPGAVLCVGYKGQIIMHEAFGKRQTIPKSLPMEISTIFDIASLTKIVATWSSIIKISGEKKLI